jgi:rhodanese-related sulfurtransferase
VDAEFVRSHVTAPGFAVVDARAASFYDGSQEGGPKDHRKAGHVAGAHNVPFSDVSTPDLKLKSPEELAAVFLNAGVQPGDTVVTYCHIGQQATATLFAALILGHPVLLYDGSFEDWARRDLPVDNPSGRNRGMFLRHLSNVLRYTNMLNSWSATPGGSQEVGADSFDGWKGRGRPCLGFELCI